MEAPRQQEMRKGPQGVKISVDLAAPWHPEDEIIESFEFDHELTWRFWADQRKAEMAVCCPLSLLALPCTLVELHFLGPNLADMSYNRWLAVSGDNIFVVRKRRKQLCRFDCQDVGEIRKVIPIANVQDVMIREPAGTAVCCFVQNVLTNVQLQTAAAHAGGEGGDVHTDPSMACLVGLKDPKRFRDVIMSLKKGTYVGRDGAAQRFPTAQATALGAPLGALGEGAAGGRVQETLDQILGTLRSIDRQLENKALVPAPAQ